MTLTFSPEQAALVLDMARHEATRLADGGDPWEARAYWRAAELTAALEAGALTVKIPSLADFADMVWSGAEDALYAAEGVGDTPGYRDCLRRLSELVGLLIAVDEAVTAQVVELERAAA